MRHSRLDSVLPRIEQKIPELMGKHRVVGAACGIVVDQELVWSKGFGFADLASGQVPDE